MRGWNFSAGPAAIPQEVIKEVQEELLEYNSSGASIIEIGHRTDIYSQVAEESKNDLIEILKIPNSHEVLFLQGGSDWDISKHSSYVHYCPNETIQGIAMHEIPKIDKPLMADMTSVILSQPLDVSKFDLIYAGAQKNIGPAGLTIVVIAKELMEKGDSSLPKILRYSEHSKANSMLNTPPTFSWYFAGKVFKWIKRSGGLDHFEALNKKKAEKLYDFIDSSDFYVNNLQKSQRSIMNVTFNLKNDDLNSSFLEESEANSLLNLKGHALVGGMRASIYNAMPEEGVTQLIQFMSEFESKYG